MLSKKRSHDEYSGSIAPTTGSIECPKSSLPLPTPPQSNFTEGTRASPASANANRSHSPALSSSSLSSLPTSTAGSQSAGPPVTTLESTSEAPGKRRKLTPAEKLQQKKEKEERARLREEKRAAKEAEDASKAEQRRIKNEERELKQRERDLAKQQKEQEKREKDEREAKKQRAQSRLGNFFAKQPVRSGTQSNDFAKAVVLKSTGHQLTAPGRQANPLAHEVQFRRFFLPFEPLQHTKLAGSGFEIADHESAGSHQRDFDDAVLDQTKRAHLPKHSNIQAFFSQPAQRMRLTAQAGVLFSQSEYEANAPSNSSDNDVGNASKLSQLDVKHIQFCEDVRPPYIGTYTRITEAQRARKVCRAPHSRVRPDTDYEYDSEAEWEEPEEGEDVMSDEDDEVESIGSADEMDEFLDDDDAQTTRARKFLNKDLDISSTGQDLCWDNQRGRSITRTDGPYDLQLMGLEWLVDVPVKSVNPFADGYWPTPAKAANVLSAAKKAASPSYAATEMQPPRTPLKSTINGSNRAVIPCVKGPLMVATAKPSKAPPAKLEGRDFDSLKEAVVGSDLTKVDLLKALKTRFPHFKNDAIRETVVSSFARVGPSASEKRWHVIQT